MSAGAGTESTPSVSAPERVREKGLSALPSRRERADAGTARRRQCPAATGRMREPHAGLTLARAKPSLDYTAAFAATVAAISAAARPNDRPPTIPDLRLRRAIQPPPSIRAHADSLDDSNGRMSARQPDGAAPVAESSQTARSAAEGRPTEPVVASAAPGPSSYRPAAQGPRPVRRRLPQHAAPATLPVAGKEGGDSDSLLPLEHSRGQRGGVDPLMHSPQRSPPPQQMSQQHPQWAEPPSESSSASPSQTSPSHQLPPAAAATAAAPVSIHAELGWAGESWGGLGAAGHGRLQLSGGRGAGGVIYRQALAWLDQRLGPGPGRSLW